MPASASKPFHVVVPERGDGGGLEASEGGPEVVALAQDGQPRQPRLHALEHDAFVQRRVAMDGHAPFGVVILLVQRVSVAKAAGEVVRFRDHGSSVARGADVRRLGTARLREDGRAAPGHDAVGTTWACARARASLATP